MPRRGRRPQRPCALHRGSASASIRSPPAAGRISLPSPCDVDNTLDGFSNGVRIRTLLELTDGRRAMTVRIEKSGAVWTIVHDRPEARNAMDPKSADELTAAFLEFDAAKDASVAVFYGAGGSFCAGWDLKYVSTLNAEYPLGELDIPVAGPRINGGEIPRGT